MTDIDIKEIVAATCSRCALDRRDCTCPGGPRSRSTAEVAARALGVSLHRAVRTLGALPAAIAAQDRALRDHTRLLVELHERGIRASLGGSMANLGFALGTAGAAATGHTTHLSGSKLLAMFLITGRVSAFEVDFARARDAYEVMATGTSYLR